MNSIQPLVSVIVPTYNQADFLKEALDALLRQTYPHWEVVIVNNHSDDNTVSVVRGFNENRFHLVNFHNHGVIAASRNEGIRRAKGEIIAFLDSDDLWKPEKMMRCVSLMNQGYDWVCHGVLERWENGETRKTIHGSKERAKYRSLLYDGNCFATSATVVRKKLLEAVGGFDERREFITAEDYDLWLRLAAITDRVSFIQEPLGVYRLHDTNASAADLRHFHAECAVISVHFDRERQKGRLHSIGMKKRYARAYYTIGRKLQDMGKIRKALLFFSRSLMSFPFFKDTYISSILAIVQAFDRTRSRAAG